MEVGLAASIIQIIHATSKAVQYLGDVKDAPAARRDLDIEVTSILPLLTSLRYRVEESKATDPWLHGIRSLAVENGSLDQFKKLMERLAEKLQPPGAGRIQRLGRALVWTLDKKETDIMLSKIHHIHAQISLSLQNDQFALSRKTDQRVLEIAEDISEIRLDQNEIAITGHRLLIADWISRLDFHQTHLAVLSSHQASTCEWFLKSEHFQRWVRRANKVLWCPGIPGAGKTVIAATAIDHIQTEFDRTNNGIAFIYCNYKEQTDQTSINLISSLLRQLATQKAFILDDLASLHHQHSSKKTRPTVVELLKELRSAVSSFTNVFIVIDALDECAEENGSREGLLESLRALPENISLMFTSRPHIRIDRSFPDVQELVVTANPNDVRVYIDSRISQSRRLACNIKQRPDIIEMIKEKVPEKIEGMFLLARLHMDSISKKSSPKTVIQALNDLSTSLDEAYKKALERIDTQEPEDRRLAIRTIYWITLAKTSLTVSALQHALAVEVGSSRLDKDAIVNEETLLSVCAGLVAIDSKSSTVGLVHYTTQDYFESIQQDRYPNAQKEIATACVTYLLYDDFASGACATDSELQTRLNNNALLEYAARYWSEHTRGEIEYIIDRIVLELLQDTLRLSCSVQITQIRPYRFTGFSQQFPKAVSGLHVTAASSLTYMAELLLEKGADLEAKDSYGSTALIWAAEGGHEAVVRLLLEKGADVEAKTRYGWTALIRAAAGGHEAVVRLLLEKGADLEAKASDGWTALIRAAAGGHEVVVRLLLEKGADVEAKVSDGSTALIGAAAGGHEAVVRLLLEKGADVEAKVSDGWTALIRAAAGGHEAVVRLLLEKGADVEAKVSDGWTALTGAAAGGHEAVVRLLLEKGADLEAKTKNSGGWTALIGAAAGGHEAVVRLLLEKGADVEARASYGSTALTEAAERGHEAVVRLLLKKGADLEARASYGSTALIGAAAGGHEAVVRLLLEKGADLEAKTKNSGGSTALIGAAAGGHEAVVRLLLEKKADLEARDSYGLTALIGAAAGGHEAVVRLLLEKGADLEARASYGSTALIGAAAGGHEAVVRLLLEKKADLEAKASGGSTALIEAAAGGHEAVVRLLLEKKADLEAKDSYGLTALIRAAVRGHEAVVQLLKDQSHSGR